MDKDVYSKPKSEEFRGTFYYDYYSSEKGNPSTNFGIELMVGPLPINHYSDKDIAIAREIVKKTNILLKEYNLNIGKWSEPEELIYVYSIKLENKKNDKNAVKTNLKHVKDLRKAFNDFYIEKKILPLHKK